MVSKPQPEAYRDEDGIFCFDCCEQKLDWDFKNEGEPMFEQDLITEASDTGECVRCDWCNSVLADKPETEPDERRLGSQASGPTLPRSAFR
jgi:hypothetical protein